jgi:hypothetical protein
MMIVEEDHHNKYASTALDKYIGRMVLNKLHECNLNGVKGLDRRC